MCGGKCKDCKCKQVVLNFNGVTVTTNKARMQSKENAALGLFQRINRQAGGGQNV